MSHYDKHDAPQVLHYNRAGTGIVLEPRVIFTIEPMLNAGGNQVANAYRFLECLGNCYFGAFEVSFWPLK